MSTKFMGTSTSAANVTRFLNTTKAGPAAETDVSLALLRHLSTGPRTLDELAEHGGGLTALLTALDKLEHEKIITVSDAAGGRSYDLTDLGRNLAAKLGV